jgi:hypothetical protein
MRSTLSVRGSDLDPDEISRQLACAADLSHRQGEPRKRGAPYREGLWEVSAAADDNPSVEQLVSTILDRVAVDAPWEELRTRFRITFGLYVLLTSENQDFVVPAAQIARLAHIGAEFWCDIYVDDTRATEGDHD